MWIKLLYYIISLILNTEDPDPDVIENLPPVLPNEFVNLHIMLTSHMEPGWTHTFDEYYNGANDSTSARAILNNVFKALPQNSSRKFDMTEVSFFKKWYEEQNLEEQAVFRTFLLNNQFDFINGGWVANDEACAYYEDIMDNFILGNRWLHDNFNVDPTAGWQVDSFGSSATQAALMAQAGYQGLFFSRADYADRAKRIVEKALQFNWKPQNPHNESIFSEMMYNTYTADQVLYENNPDCKTIFCLGLLDSEQYEEIAEYAREQKDALQTREVLLLISNDFILGDKDDKNFAGIDAMIEYYSNNPHLGINAKTTHLTEYVEAVKQELLQMDQKKSALPVKKDDFFPYIEKPLNTWTGYFTSKSMYKLLVREYSEYYNAAKLFLAQLLLLNNTDILEGDAHTHERVNKALNGLEEPLAIAQHHESITGTMQEYVRRDYEQMLSGGKQNLDSILTPVMGRYLNQRIGENPAPYNVRYDYLYQDDQFDKIFNSQTTPTFVVFNPGNAREMLVKIKVPSYKYKIIDESNTEILVDRICTSRNDNEECFIYFTDAFAPYSSKVYKILASDDAQMLNSTAIGKKDVKLNITDNLFLSVHSDMQNFDYKYCLDDVNCITDSFGLTYEYYESGIENNKSPSGAYVFSPRSDKRLNYSTIVSGRIFKGKYMTLIQIFRDNVRTDLKILYHQPERGIEIESYLDPVSNYTNGKEIVMVIRSTNIKNKDTAFYTDANGYYMQKRQKLDTSAYEVNEGISANFYPMTSSLYIENASKQRLSIVTDRSQGVTAVVPGEIQIMLHRVTVTDDLKGVNEALQEKDSKTGEMVKVTTRHYLSYSQAKIGLMDQRRQQQYDLDRAVQLWFFGSDNQKFIKKNNDQVQKGIMLPNLVKLYVRSYQYGEYIVRLHNLDEIETKMVQVYDLSTGKCSLFNDFAWRDDVMVDSIVELSWMTTKLKSQIARNQLDTDQPKLVNNDKDKYSAISLLPMEIRTFKIVVKF